MADGVNLQKNKSKKIEFTKFKAREIFALYSGSMIQCKYYYYYYHYYYYFILFLSLMLYPVKRVLWITLN